MSGVIHPRAPKGAYRSNRVLTERGNQFKANNGMSDFDLDQSPKEMAPTKCSWGQDGVFTCGVTCS
jgi:hypothetical protein